MLRTTRRDGAQRGRVVVLVAVVLTTVICVVGWRLARRWNHSSEGQWRDDVRRLSHRMEIEEVVVNLSGVFDRSTVMAEAPEAPVYIGRVEPGFKLHVAGRGRQAIVASPPSHVLFRARVPSGATFRFGAGVEGDGKRDRKTRGIRFAVDVDGREAFARVINPAARRGDRRWFDASVDLRAEEDREVEIALRTQAVGAGPRLGGTPAWSHLRILRETVRDRQPARRTTPNVLVLLVDALRADRLGCYGASPSPSPVLDGLAREGLLFEEVVSQSAWTMPSVASLFTGLHPRSHGLVGASRYTGDAGRDGTQYDSDPSYLPDSLSTLAARAQLAGITTVGVSANPLVSRGTNLARGFETFVESGFQGRSPTWRRAEEVNGVFLDWLRKNGRHRFLAYLHYMDVHDPYTPPEAYRPPAPDNIRSRVARGDVEHIAKEIQSGSGASLTTGELAYLRALYDAQIRYWDAQLAVLLEGLSAAAARDTTVLVVTSDHGEEFLEHGRLRHGAHLYEEQIRVPLVVSGPTVGRGRVPEQAQGIDFYPTVAGLLGLEAPRELPGQNIIADHAGRPAVSETHGGVDPDGAATSLVSLRTPGWKLIYHRASGSFELYDLASDPGEQQNVYGAAPEGSALVRALADWQATAPPPPEPGGRDPEFREKLRALGYVE